MIAWLKMKFARFLDRSPNRCSAWLTLWAIGWHEWQDGFDATTCKSDAERCGMCWCGKFCREDWRQFPKQVGVGPKLQKPIEKEPTT